MTNMLYHGSITAEIIRLEARSILHGTDQRIVYLTNSIPYALFYIWDIYEGNAEMQRFMQKHFEASWRIANGH